MPSAAAGGAHTRIIERLGNGRRSHPSPVSGARLAARGGEGVRGPRFVATPLACAVGRLVRFPRTAPCAFFCASAARVRSAINACGFRRKRTVIPIDCGQ
jgi:hypothetical protein